MGQYSSRLRSNDIRYGFRQSAHLISITSELGKQLPFTIVSVLVEPRDHQMRSLISRMVRQELPSQHMRCAKCPLSVFFNPPIELQSSSPRSLESSRSCAEVKTRSINSKRVSTSSSSIKSISILTTKVTTLYEVYDEFLKHRLNLFQYMF